MENRDSCVFYASWLDAIEAMPDNVRGEALMAILVYALRGETTEKQGAMTKVIMAMVKPQIEANNKRYENGCKGGRPKVEKPNHNQNETKTKPNHNQNETKTAIRLGDNVNDNVNDNVSLSFEEREKIFEIFYFERNLITAKEECEKFINHYEANGWCRGNSDKPVKNKVALAKSWKVEREEKRYPENIRKWLLSCYLLAREKGLQSCLLFEVEKIFVEGCNLVIQCSRQIANLIEAVQIQVPRDFTEKPMYRIRKEA